jgi:prevent-host-death family protein
MAVESEVSGRELNNNTSRILRHVAAGERLTVIKRGRPVAVIEALSQTSAAASDSIYRSLQRQIEARTPGLRRTSSIMAQRDVDLA